MSIRERKWKGSDGKPRRAWIYDFTITFPDGSSSGRIRGTYDGPGGRREAEAHERQVMASVLAGTWRAPVPEAQPVVTLVTIAKQYVEKLRDDLAVEKRGHRDLDEVICFVDGHLTRYFADAPVGSVDAEAVERFKVHLARDGRKPGSGFAPKTVFNHMSMTRRILAFAVVKKHIAAVPMIDWPKLTEPPPRFYSFEEADRLIVAGDEEPFWGSMIRTALRCGLRIGELRAAQWECVDFRSGLLHVTRAITKVRGAGQGGKTEEHVTVPKNGKTRSVPMPPSVVAALRDHPRRVGSPWVWPGEDGSWLRENAVKHPMWRACRRAGLAEDGWHICRHTFASHLVQRGVHLLEVQALAGHSNYKSTLRYAHVAPSRHAASVALLDQPAPSDDGPAAELAR